MRMKNWFAALLICATLPLSATAQEPARDPAQAESAAPVSDEHVWRFGVGGGIALGGTGNFREVKDSSVPYTLEAEIGFTSAALVKGEARYMAPNSWGFLGSLQFEREREVDTFKVGGVTYNVSSGAKLQVTTLLASAVYQWENWYLPFGLNFSSLKYTPPSGFSGSTDSTSGLGFQIGVGYLINENFSVEGMSRSASWKLSAKPTGGGETDYGTGTFSTLVVSGTYWF